MDLRQSSFPLSVFSWRLEHTWCGQVDPLLEEILSRNILRVSEICFRVRGKAVSVVWYVVHKIQLRDRTKSFARVN